MLALFLLLLLPPASSLRFIVLQLDPSANDVTRSPVVSAQFRLSSNGGGGGGGWECPAAVHPLTFPAENGHVMRAASLEMSPGDRVECLGLGVRVVARERVERWSGERTECGDSQSHRGEVTDLQISSRDSNISFTFIPAAPFRVYFTQPAEECVARETVFVDRPGLVFGRGKNTSEPPRDCRVTGWKPGMECNMSVTVGPGNHTIGVGTRVTRLPIPELIWTIANLTLLTCTSECTLPTSSPHTNTITLPIVPDPSSSSHAMSSRIISREFGSVDPCQSYLISLSLLIAAFLVALLSSLFLFFVSRNLNSRLNNKNKTFGMPQRRKARTTMYSQVEAPRVPFCRHYDTASSLRVSECPSIKEMPLEEEVRGVESPIYDTIPSKG